MKSPEKVSAPDSVLRDAESANLGQTAETWEKMGLFLARVRETAGHMNLVADSTPEVLWNRHLLDSLTLLPYLKGDERLVDIGSGAGFPAIPLALACPGLRLTAIESTGKKARFLLACVEELGLNNLDVLGDRAEAVGHRPGYREGFSLATGRAVCALRRFLEYTIPLLEPGGRVLAMKGERVAEEVREAEKALTLLKANVAGIRPAWPGDEAFSRGSIVEIHKQSPTSPNYPRSAQQIKKQPL